MKPHSLVLFLGRRVRDAGGKGVGGGAVTLSVEVMLTAERQPREGLIPDSSLDPPGIQKICRMNKSRALNYIYARHNGIQLTLWRVGGEDDVTETYIIGQQPQLLCISDDYSLFHSFIQSDSQSIQ